MKDRKLRLTALALVLTLLLTACGRDSTLPTPDISAGELPGRSWASPRRRTPCSPSITAVRRA